MAGRIPQSFIDDLLNRADIVDVVDARVRLKKTGKNYSGLCPFHEEKTPSFTIQPDKQFYYCFGCGAGGNVLGFLMNYEGLDFVPAIEMLAAYAGVEVPHEEESPSQRQHRQQQQTLYEILTQAAQYYQQQLRHHTQKQRAVDYLKQRGLSGEIARDFGLGYAPPGWENLLKALGKDEKARGLLKQAGMLIEREQQEAGRSPFYDRFRDRIMFPIRDRRGRVIGFGGRVLGNDKPKYLNSPETPVFQKGRELYGLFEARRKLREPQRFLIVEGYMDVIALAQLNIPYAVATLGTATSTDHLQILFRQAPELVFCFDGDKAGRQAAWRALEQTLPLMQDGRSARFLFLPDGEDPDSHVRRIGSLKFEEQVRGATRLADFFFESLGHQVDRDSIEGRARLGSLAMPSISLLPQGIYRQLMLDQLASLTGVDQQTLQGMASSPAPAAAHHQSPPPTSQASSAPSSRPPPSPPSRGQALPPGPPAAETRAPQRLSACMRAVNLLLLQPDVARDVDLDALQEIHSPDIELLCQLVALGRQFPNSSTPELLARLYATPLGSQLLQLADREQITPPDGIAREFNDILRHLLDTHQRRVSHDSLLRKARERLLARRSGKP